MKKFVKRYPRAVIKRIWKVDLVHILRHPGETPHGGNVINSSYYIPLPALHEYAARAVDQHRNEPS